jgi:hypothetical protein
MLSKRTVAVVPPWPIGLISLLTMITTSENATQKSTTRHTLSVHHTGFVWALCHDLVLSQNLTVISVCIDPISGFGHEVLLQGPKDQSVRHRGSQGGQHLLIFGTISPSGLHEDHLSTRDPTSLRSEAEGWSRLDRCILKPV